MSFHWIHGALHCEQVSLADIAAQAGTPVYVYSKADILGRFAEYTRALVGCDHTICYAVKANSNLSVLRVLAQAGSGFDIVSGGELFRVLKAGADPAKIVFSGVGKTVDEIAYAIDCGIFSFNSESEEELVQIDEVAGKAGIRARVALRVNPDVDAETHPYISTGLREHKFGIDISEARAVYSRALKLSNLSLESVSCHIGSQILNPASIHEAIQKMVDLAVELRSIGVPIRHLDLGGGLGVAYKPGDKTPSITDFVNQVRKQTQGRGLHLLFEPGRSLVAEAGVLVTRVLSRKRNGAKEFVIIDAAMNDLIRPALYNAYHDIVPVLMRAGREMVTADIVGPVCETGDFLARDREMPFVEPGEMVAVKTAGAYGFVMASNYNSRPRAAEVLVDGGSYTIARARETYENLISGEV